MINLGYTKFKIDNPEKAQGRATKDGKSFTMTTICDRNYGVVVEDECNGREIAKED